MKFASKIYKKKQKTQKKKRLADIVVVEPL
jgi:hypothetical protein